MEWSKAQRYLPYDQWSAAELLKLQAQATNSPYQLQYHIRPQSGLLNDPNGFCYFNGKYHVFYQSFPFGAVHGLKSWMHEASSDLVHWENLGLAILPDRKYDSHGAYSGSAIAIDDKLFLMYTGNHRDQNWQRTAYQLGAWMDKQNQITKVDQPLFKNDQAVTEHFRDPQILRQNGRYYAIIGAQDAQTKAGEILVYESLDLSSWQKVGRLNLDPLGYMIECPNLVYVDGRPVLIFCPQGLDKKQVHYDNIYPNIYLVLDEIDLATATVKVSQPLRQLDFGFDVYASQAFNQGTDCYLISWAGLPDITYPTDSENWANCLSQVKELHLKDNQLIQKPVKAMKSLRQNGEVFKDQTSLFKQTDNQYELSLTIDKNQLASLELAKDSTSSLKVKFDTINGKLTLTRDQGAFAQKYGLNRSVNLEANSDIKVDIFVDHSLIEIFVNDGQAVLTSRFFNLGTGIEFLAPCKYQATYWPIVK